MKFKGMPNVGKFSLAELGKKQTVGFTLAYVIIILLLVFLVKGKAVSLRAISMELSKKRVLVEEAKELINGAERYRQEIVQLEKRIKAYEAKLPEQREVPQLFRELDEMAGQSQIKIISVGSEEFEERQHHRRYWRGLGLEGGYHELGRFINKLESLDRFIKVDDIEIISDPENLLKHNIKLTVSTFVSRETI